MTDINRTRPMIMHIDLNSCFATIEQQSRPMLRGKPVAIVNRRHQNSTIVTASYEAKARGVKVGMRGATARLLCPTLIFIESDPPKYRYVYRRLLAILADYSPKVQMKSIDEGLIDFSQSPLELQQKELSDIGREIKHRLRTEIGEHMMCNIGIGTNRFLAKTAAGLDKPDGLTEINHQNLRQIYTRLTLEDLTGIAKGYGTRLRQVGITTPLGLLDADELTLEKIVFRGKTGRDWYRRLRGWEVDAADHQLKSVGRQFVLDEQGLNHADILRRFHGLGNDVVAKLRAQGVKAHSVRVYVQTHHVGRWQNFTHRARAFDDEATLFSVVKQLFQSAPLPAQEIGVTCYGLVPREHEPVDLFGEAEQIARLTEAIDEINIFWGDRTVRSADTLGLDGHMKRKVPFGSTRFL